MGYLATAGFVDLLNVDYLFSFLGNGEEAALAIDDKVRPLRSFRTAPPKLKLIDFRYTRSMRKRYTCT